MRGAPQELGGSELGGGGAPSRGYAGGDLSASLPTSKDTVKLALSQLPPGRTVVVRRVGGARSYRRRLLELGFVPGTELRVVRRVEVGGVLEVELRHSRVTLRISEAQVLEVESICETSDVEAGCPGCEGCRP